VVGSRRPSVWHVSLISLSRPMAIPNSRITESDESRMLLLTLTQGTLLTSLGGLRPPSFLLA